MSLDSHGLGSVVSRPHHHHEVQFYEKEDFLADAVARFLAVGLSAGEPALVIATPDHQAAFARALERRGVDVAAERAAGALVTLDARETLAALLVDGKPDWGRFEPLMSRRIGELRGGRSVPVRAFGEMVDLLWRDANASAAVELEEMWNELGRTERFSLLCAYVMDNFVKESDGDAFQQVCRAHSHVVPADGYSRLGSTGDRGREISVLQQRARALEGEVVHRRELERALRESLREGRRARDELADFLENAVFPMHSVGPDGTILWANRAELELFGYARDEYVGRPIAAFHVDAHVIADILERLARGEQLREREARVRCKDGSIKIVLVSSNVAFEDGEFVRTRCFTQDVTARKQAEAERVASQGELVAALEGEKLARAEAERTVRYNEMFAGILGHDLRNPLAAITAGGHYLLRMDAGEKVSKTASRVLSSADRMARMIDQLLDFTRIRVGDGLPLRPASLDLDELCRRVKDEIEAAHADRSVDVVCEGSTVGEWDADRLLQVFSNLISNAIHHGRAGERVRVAVDARDPDVIAVEVHNGGVVPADVLPALFEPFRGTNKHQRSKGLGLGLFITQQIVLAHGGDIEVASSEERGTTFRVRLPRVSAPCGAGE